MPNFLDHLSQAFQKKKNNSAVSTTSLGIGSLLDQRYRLDAEIGRGGMGIVYRAFDLHNHRDVAIKVINAGTANALSLGQFAREAEISTKLSHPHIVSVYETGTVDTGSGTPTPYIVMELVQGKGLDEIGSLTYTRIIDIAKQICDALSHAHDQGYVYRDLKPGNVLLVKHGFRYFVKLLDFGLARPRGEAYLPNESSLAGTVFYLAPELIAGQPADVCSDLYALGILLYEMITGRVPFSNIDEQTILDQHMKEKVSPPSRSRSDVPPQLEALVLRLLEKNPQDRFPSAQEVLQVLEQIPLGESAVGNLPQTVLEGRDEEILQVMQLIEISPLVTLLSDDEPLALAVASRLAGQFADGVWLVRFESEREPARVLPMVISTLGVSENPNRPPLISLIEFMREKNLLLVLAHCGLVSGACAQLIAAILDSCPDVRILTTSRQPLGHALEKCFTG